MTDGHVVLPHTADVRIEAWGVTAGHCYEEAVAALVDVFADTSRATDRRTVPFRVGPADPDVLLVLLLEEVLLHLDVRGLVPVDARVEVRGDELEGTLDVVDVDTVEVVGAIPKGISYADLRFGEEDGRWQCQATIDV
jgi:SHS2 domain-containing protein